MVCVVTNGDSHKRSAHSLNLYETIAHIKLLELAVFFIEFEEHQWVGSAEVWWKLALHLPDLSRRNDDVAWSHLHYATSLVTITRGLCLDEVDQGCDFTFLHVQSSTEQACYGR